MQSIACSVRSIPTWHRGASASLEVSSSICLLFLFFFFLSFLTHEPERTANFTSTAQAIQARSQGTVTLQSSYMSTQVTPYVDALNMLVTATPLVTSLRVCDYVKRSMAEAQVVACHDGLLSVWLCFDHRSLSISLTPQNREQV